MSTEETYCPEHGCFRRLKARIVSTEHPTEVALSDSEWEGAAGEYPRLERLEEALREIEEMGHTDKCCAVGIVWSALKARIVSTEHPTEVALSDSEWEGPAGEYPRMELFERALKKIKEMGHTDECKSTTCVTATGAISECDCAVGVAWSALENA
jgi:hypothetical protein